MKIILTNLPAFYKIKLFNAINEFEDCFVIYTSNCIQERRKDFFQEDAKFRYIMLKGGKFRSALKLINIILFTKYDEFIIGGWDEIYNWICAFLSPKGKNSLIVESSCYESTTTGIKGLIKRLFLYRISKIYASGKSQKKLCTSLRFKGDKIVITQGVGIFNYHEQPPYKPIEKIKKFLYVGRFSPEKNLSHLITVFNKFPELNLNLIGYGEQEEELKYIAGNNINFIGHVNNTELSKYYQENDVFVLPSLIEPWGLVVEEALNNGLPVIVSDRVGCGEEIIQNGINGFIFKLEDNENLVKCIREITNINVYNTMRYNISKLNFEEIERRQVQCYLK